MHLQRRQKRDLPVLLYHLFIGNGIQAVAQAPSHASTVATRTESTMFDQAYGSQRRRPAMISLDVHWVPVPERSGSYQWNGSDANGAKMKTVTYFGTGTMRGQQTLNATTPPSSNYTDAYLSAFAAKSIPTRQIHRLSTQVFENAAPIPLKPISTPLSISSSMKTSESRVIEQDHYQRSNTFDRIPPPVPSRNASSYSSSFLPERSNSQQAFSTKDYLSSQSQTYTSNYSTSLRSPSSCMVNTPSPTIEQQQQRTYTSFPTRSQPTFSTIQRTDPSYDSIYKPMPPYSLQAYPPSTTPLPLLPLTVSGYKPYSPYPTVSSYSMNESITSRRILAPSPYTSRILDRPETLSFPQSDPIQLSPIDNVPSIPSPSSESPAVQEKANVEPVYLPVEELVTASAKPIEILENTINKYDSLIDQIAAVLASVSPMSSNVSSMSPSKNPMDYELSSDSSPVLSHRRAEQPTISTFVQHAVEPQRNHTKHLIREDSYDKIVTAISDLDSELVDSSNHEILSDSLGNVREESRIPTIVEDEATSVRQESTLEASDVDDRRNEQIETETAVAEEDQTLTVAEVEDEMILASDHVTTEIQSEPTTDALLSASDVDQQQDAPAAEETDDMADKRADKHVTWDESIVDDEEIDGNVNGVVSQVAPYESEEQLADIPEEDTNDTLAADSTSAGMISEDTKIIIASPVDSLPESVSNRYTSSDVYHGYLGEHQQFSTVSSSRRWQIYRPKRACFPLISKDAADEETTKKSLFASLRETITAPIAPLIESIQSVVSSMQTLGDHSLVGENLVHEQESQLEASNVEV